MRLVFLLSRRFSQKTKEAESTLNKAIDEVYGHEIGYITAITIFMQKELL